MLLFPFELIQKNSRIVLYGAGDCGIQFFRQIINTGFCDVVLWVDRRAEEIENGEDRYGYKFPISGIEKLRDFRDFDYVVIAIVNKDVSKGVKEQLASEFEIPEEKIISTCHEYALDTVYPNNRVEDLHENSVAKESKVEDLYLVNELSVMPRYLVARDIVNNVYNEANLSLYKRTVLAQGDIFTKENYFVEREKKSTDEFIDEFRKLVETMRVSDYDQRKYVPVVYGNRLLLDGQHRIASAAALEKEIFVKYYPDHKDYGTGFGFDWFVKNGFNSEDMQRILYAYGNIYKQCGIFVLFGTQEHNWDYFVEQIKKKCTVVGCVDLDFAHDYVGFENVIRDFYWDPLWLNTQIHLKTKLLKLAPLKLRVVLVSNQDNKMVDIYECIRETKLILRDSVSEELEVLSGAVMHATDTYEEYVWLRELLLSVNTCKNMSRIVSRNYRPLFIEKLEKYRKFIYEKGIRPEETMIVGGSILEVLGLRQSDDIDFIVSSKGREILGDGYCKISDDFELCAKDSIVMENDVTIPDDVLIYDENLHIQFYGLKFLNPEILKSKKTRDARPKDVEDVKLLNMFFEYASNFDNKLELRKQIDRELHMKRFL